MIRYRQVEALEEAERSVTLTELANSKLGVHALRLLLWLADQPPDSIALDQAPLTVATRTRALGQLVDFDFVRIIEGKIHLPRALALSDHHRPPIPAPSASHANESSAVSAIRADLQRKRDAILRRS